MGTPTCAISCDTVGGVGGEGEGHSLADDQLPSFLFDNLRDVGCGGHSQTGPQDNDQVSLREEGESTVSKGHLALLHRDVASPHKS